MSIRLTTGYGALKADTYFLMEIQQTNKKEKNASTTVEIEPLEIHDIPKAMKVMGWKKSAALMTRWLNSPAWKCPENWKDGKELPQGMYIPDQHCDDTTITMSWLMNYPHARRAVDDLLNERAFSAAGMKVLANRLKKLGWDGRGRYTFGRRNIFGKPTLSARELEHNYQNNYISVGDNALYHMTFDTMDDVYGALGTYNLKCAIIGSAYRDYDRKVYVDTDYVGVYVKDFYDFNNDGWWDQPLGLWTKTHILTRGDSVIGLANNLEVWEGKKKLQVSAIFNSDFLKYREKTGKGGDMIVFSDVLWIKHKGKYALPWGD